MVIFQITNHLLKLALFFLCLLIKSINFMKFFRLFLLFFLSAFLFTSIAAQSTKVPQAARDNFAKQYPGAQNVGWDNDLLQVQVRFELDGKSLMAEYNNKGIWKKTEQR